MDYFLIFGIITILFIVAVIVILRMIYQTNELKYELKLAKVNCQKDLDRIEDKINQLVHKDSSYYFNEMQKLEKLQNTLAKLIDSQVNKFDSQK
jgi:predicted Holliday junction resolvase-like endonuclease